MPRPIPKPLRSTAVMPLADGLPGESRRIWTVGNDFLGGLEQSDEARRTPPKTAHDIRDAMDELKRAASKPNADGGYPTEEDLQPGHREGEKSARRRGEEEIIMEL